MSLAMADASGARSWLICGSHGAPEALRKHRRRREEAAGQPATDAGALCADWRLGPPPPQCGAQSPPVKSSVRIPRYRELHAATRNRATCCPLHRRGVRTYYVQELDVPTRRHARRAGARHSADAHLHRRGLGSGRVVRNIPKSLRLSSRVHVRIRSPKYVAPRYLSTYSVRAGGNGEGGGKEPSAALQVLVPCTSNQLMTRISTLTEPGGRDTSPQTARAARQSALTRPPLTVAHQLGLASRHLGRRRCMAPERPPTATSRDQNASVHAPRT